jgi:hypothetical protein
MNLTNEAVRKSFVIMLFALAPEFVKMIESSVRISLERVQSMTEAPHANERMVDVAGELFKDGLVSSSEHVDLMETFSNLRVNTTDLPSPSSIQETPEDVVGINDSISQAGDRRIVVDNSPMNQRTLMRYIKNNKSSPSDNFYDRFPGAKKPVMHSRTSNRNGIGYTTANSAFTEAVTEDNIGVAMNAIMEGYTTSRRHKLTDSDREVFKKPVRFTEADSSLVPERARKDSMGMQSEDNVNMEITMDDINEMKIKNGNKVFGGSRPVTVESSSEIDLLSLL